MLDELAGNISSLRTLSKRAIKTSLPFLRSLDTQKSIILKKFLKKSPNTPRDVALEKLQHLSLEALELPKLILSEIDMFEKNILSEEDLFNNRSEYTYLAQVWYGDVYDVTGVESLKLLCLDLAEVSSSVKRLDKILIDKAVGFFTPSKEEDISPPSSSETREE